MNRIVRLPPQAPSFFDPNRSRMMLAQNASAYERAHEEAHLEQQQAWTLAWRAHRRGMQLPWLCRWTRLWLEIEAAQMALTGMKRRGTWTHAAEREARAETAWYCASIFVSADTASRIREWMRR